MGVTFAGSGRLAVAWPAGGDGPVALSPWALSVEAGRIMWVGDPSDAPDGDQRLDLGSALVTPGLIDSHTHPVFAGDRADEAAARLEGAAYSGGGILRTVAVTRATDDAELERLVDERLGAALAAGTTTVECKSGYGLSPDEELRHLRILGRAAARTQVRIVRTFLGAHAVPEGAAPAEYVELVENEMIPAVAADDLADFVDVFCERGFFGLGETRRVLEAAHRSGLGMRLHAEQLARTGAAELGVEMGVASVDHLEQLDAAGVATLAGSATVATLLPGPATTMRGPMPPARALLDGGATVALASDANAGTFGRWGAMPLVIGLASGLLGMTVLEALNAATMGGAAALGLARRAGAVRPGAWADLVAWDAEHEGAFALHLGDVRPSRVWIAGEEVEVAAP